MERRIILGMELTHMQQLFVQEYLVDLNATQAAIRAGYSPETAASQGHRLLRNVEIEEKIKSAMDARAERTGITADRVLSELAAIGFASMGDYLTTESNGNHKLNFAKLTRDQMAGITEIKIESNGMGGRKVQIKLKEKLAALVLMGRHLDRNIAVPERDALPPSRPRPDDSTVTSYPASTETADGTDWSESDDGQESVPPAFRLLYDRE